MTKEGERPGSRYSPDPFAWVGDRRMRTSQRETTYGERYGSRSANVDKREGSANVDIFFLHVINHFKMSQCI